MAKLTISQTLRSIKSAKGRIAELRKRAEMSVSHEVEKKPTFDFGELREEIAVVKEKLIGMESAVAVANATHRIEFEERSMPLAEAIRWLQEIKDDLSWLPHLQLRDGVERNSEVEYDEDTGRPKRVVTTITYVTELSELERVAEIDRLRDRFERLNNQVERANHETPVEWTDG